MKLPVYIFALGAMLLAGCGNNNQSKPAQGTNAAAGGNPLDTGGGYVGALGRAQNNAVKTIDTTSLDEAVQMFNVQEGRLPKDLNELVEKKLIGKIPPAPFGMKLDYDPSTGKVSVVKQ
jgi:hypothetical protein